MRASRRVPAHPITVGLCCSSVAKSRRADTSARSPLLLLLTMARRALPLRTRAGHARSACVCRVRAAFASRASACFCVCRRCYAAQFTRTHPMQLRMSYRSLSVLSRVVSALHIYAKIFPSTIVQVRMSVTPSPCQQRPRPFEGRQHGPSRPRCTSKIAFTDTEAPSRTDTPRSPHGPTTVPLRTQDLRTPMYKPYPYPILINAIYIMCAS